jgi:hypothetical protein
MRKVDGWQMLDTTPIDEKIDLESAILNRRRFLQTTPTKFAMAPSTELKGERT